VAGLTDWLREYIFPDAATEVDSSPAVPQSQQPTPEIRAPPVGDLYESSSANKKAKSKTVAKSKASAKAAGPALPASAADADPPVFQAKRWATASSSTAPPVSVLQPPPLPPLQKARGAKRAAAVGAGYPSEPHPKPVVAHPATPAASRTTGSRLPKPPLPKQAEVRGNFTYFISPFDVHFTQDSIGVNFSAQDDDPTKKPSLMETAMECIKEGIPDKIEILDVVWHEGKVYVAGSFNRRLCVYRLLNIFFPQDFRAMKVRFKPEREKDKLFRFTNGDNRFTTYCQGHWIQVRSKVPSYVGKQKDPDPRWHSDQDGWHRYDPGVQWPEAHRAFGKLCSSQGSV